MYLRLTFNKPANRTYFEENAASGLPVLGLRMRIDVKSHRLAFQPVSSLGGEDVLELFPLPRGGFSIEIAKTDLLLKQALIAVRHPQRNPFFILSRSSDWVLCRPYVESEMSLMGKTALPSKIIPHMRVWMRSSEPEPIEASPLIHRVKQAYQDVREFETTRSKSKLGRPPRKIAEARMDIAMFETAARENMPDFGKMKAIYEELRQLVRGQVT